MYECISTEEQQKEKEAADVYIVHVFHRGLYSFADIMNPENARPSPPHSRSSSNISSISKCSTPTRPRGPQHSRSITSWSNPSPTKSIGRGESTRFIQVSKQCVFMDMEDLVPLDKQDKLQKLVEEFLLLNAADNHENTEELSPISATSTANSVRDSVRIQLSRKFVFMDMDNIVPNRKQEDLAALIEKFLDQENPDDTSAASHRSSPSGPLISRESSIIRFSRKFVFRDMSHLVPHVRQSELEELVENFLQRIPDDQLLAENAAAQEDHTRQPSVPPSPAGSVDSRPTSTRIIEVSRKFVFMDMTDLVPPQYQDSLEDAVRSFLGDEGGDSKHDSTTALLGGSREKRSFTRSISERISFCTLI